MTGATNIQELITHLRDEAQRWKVREFEAMRESRDQDAAECLKQHIRCTNLAAELCTAVMESNDDPQ